MFSFSSLQVGTTIMIPLKVMIQPLINGILLERWEALDPGCHVLVWQWKWNPERPQKKSLDGGGSASLIRFKWRLHVGHRGRQRPQTRPVDLIRRRSSPLWFLSSFMTTTKPKLKKYILSKLTSSLLIMLTEYLARLDQIESHHNGNFVIR